MTVQGTNRSSNGTEYCPILAHKTQCDVVHWCHVAMGILSVLACVYIIVLLCCLKRGKLKESKTERLIIYLTSAVFLNTIHYLIGYYHTARQAENGKNVTLCIFEGWFFEITAWIANFWVCIVVLNICWLVKYFKNFMEGIWWSDLLLWGVNVLFSLVISSIPFTMDAYGSAGIWCWINGRSKKGIILQLVLYYALWIALCVLIAIALTMASIVVCLRFMYLGVLQSALIVVKITFATQYTLPVPIQIRRGGEDGGRDAKRKIKTLMPLPWIYIFCFALAAICRMTYDEDDQYDSLGWFALWLLVAIFLPLPGVAFAVVITLTYGKEIKNLVFGDPGEEKPLLSINT